MTKTEMAEKELTTTKSQYEEKVPLANSVVMVSYLTALIS